MVYPKDTGLIGATAHGFAEESLHVDVRQRRARYKRPTLAVFGSLSSMVRGTGSESNESNQRMAAAGM